MSRVRSVFCLHIGSNKIFKISQRALNIPVEMSWDHLRSPYFGNEYIKSLNTFTQTWILHISMKNLQLFSALREKWAYLFAVFWLVFLCRRQTTMDIGNLTASPTSLDKNHGARQNPSFPRINKVSMSL